MGWECDKCGKTFQDSERALAEKHEKNCKRVQEYKRKCNQCGKVWHSLVDREKQLEEGVKCDACIQTSTALSGNLGSATQSKRNVAAGQNSLESLRKCPKCGSQNYKEDIISYEKK